MHFGCIKPTKNLQRLYKKLTAAPQKTYIGLQNLNKKLTFAGPRLRLGHSPTIRACTRHDLKDFGR